MDKPERSELARQALDGYFSGLDAPVLATTAALERAKHARAVVLVEGISDQMALEALAVRRGRDLDVDRVIVVPAGGAHGIGLYAEQFGPNGAALPVAGMCDAGEEAVVRRALAQAGLGSPKTRGDLNELGFFVCDKDLEDELIRAVGQEAIEGLLESQGDLSSFRTLQAQPQWRGRPFEAQIHRWLKAGSRRPLRYARLLVQAVELDLVPRPLDAVLTRIDLL